ncbi:MAG: cytochrome c3 family protein [Planctomycetes bacterium]|nr:cytochrome c3 family protein [Planctomycetota bacterium]
MIGIALGLTAACSVIHAIMPSAAPPPRPFNHASHLRRGPDCLSCHEDAETQAEAGMPSMESCLECHEELDQDPAKPPERKASWYLDPSGRPVWSAFTEQSPEIRFSHQAHATANVECAQCHVGIDKNKGLQPGLVQRMESCTACHAAQAPRKNECSTCHTQLDRDHAPPDHLRMWSTLHGRRAREGPAAHTANDCSMCHQNDSCVTCHQTRLPDDHNGAWRFQPHGIAASIDRGRCTVCHASDMCVRCHEETSPRSHTAGWNAPQDRHCVSCHLPLQFSGGCFACHRSAPGHDLVPPMPPWHNLTMDCRPCHSIGLRHPDNGDACTACHR